ncbi:high-affinity branched-chain amino acid ABC transporter permease LivM [Inmirania thermothiophila]|uniref:Amino acid/amide ABC transporter membrane protein 2 (HAAT family) n=1 Tax=Inmirania thermothiophila TaxID=1750597 RepID=A0A3N1Y1Z7_9GAMM|nr:high-affinity branched-chain amino acid ABC transporter permease LivM [Inmirania thermothiophila]ROR32855.1 amino acid/amide ABC transporter membrane protein 2 (HAAT family) [Inmirania thermothiophila]
MNRQSVTAARGRIDLGEILKDSGLAALVALLLAFPLVGFQTVDQVGGRLGLNTRFDWVAVGVGAVFVGRVLVRLLAALWPRREEGRKGVMARAGLAIRPYMRWIGAAGIAFAIVLPFLPFASRYVVDLATGVLIYVMLGWGLNIVVGLAGLLDLGYVAFYAVGAYSYALLSVHFGLSFWVVLPLAGLLAATFGVILGFPVLRLRGDYLAIVTLGFGEIIRVVLLNWYKVTNGPDGISGIPRPTFFGLPFARTAPDGGTTFHQFFGLEYAGIHRIIFLYYLILALALITNFFTLRIRRLPVGRAWEALREDEIACRSLGINPTNTKLTAFGIGAMFGGFAGSFFATRQGFISPESFTFIESATILAIVVLGGMGSQIGVVLAAMVLILLPEFGREFAQYRMLFFGAAMVMIMVWRPQGLLAFREPTVRLHARSEGEAER